MKIPKLCYHKATGQGYVRVGGKCRYLGRYGTPDCEENYRAAVRALVEHGPAAVAQKKQAGPMASVAEALDGYLAWAEERYRHEDGTPTGQIGRVRPAVGLFRELYGPKPAAKVTARELDAARREMARRDWNRGTIANATGVLRRCWGWLVSRGHAPAEALVGMQALEPLRRGQWGVREARVLRDVPEADYLAVLARLRERKPDVARMVAVQWATGARTEEVRLMRWEEIDWGGAMPVYRPARHKLSHKGLAREVVLFPEAVAELPARRAAGLVFARGPGLPWNADLYAKAVRRACKAVKVVPWTPYQLRHAAATRFQRLWGWEAAARLLGHAPGSRVTGRYVHHKVADLIDLLKPAG